MNSDDFDLGAADVLVAPVILPSRAITVAQAEAIVRLMAVEDHETLGNYRALSDRAFEVVRKHGDLEDRARLAAACEILGEDAAAEHYDDEWVRMIGPVPQTNEQEMYET